MVPSFIFKIPNRFIDIISCSAKYSRHTAVAKRESTAFGILDNKNKCVDTNTNRRRRETDTNKDACVIIFRFSKRCFIQGTGKRMPGIMFRQKIVWNAVNRNIQVCMMNENDRKQNALTPNSSTSYF